MEAGPSSSRSSEEIYRCPFGCNGTFVTKVELMGHIQLEHNDLVEEEPGKISGHN